MLTLIWSCGHKAQEKRLAGNGEFAVYNKAVKDTFHISVQLPEEYDKNKTKRYPVAVVLDGNFYFPMLAAAVKQYDEAGLLQPVILVGVGYKSFQEMDSLRNRDYLYPSPLPGDETKSTGGGLNFYNFISKQLLPKIDSSYRTQKDDKTLLGHSFGGYFSMFALLQQEQNHTQVFSNFIAASPSMWFHNFYLSQLPPELKKYPPAEKMNVFISAGSLENDQWEIQPVIKFGKEVNDLKVNNLIVETELYNSLHHMDTGLLTFIKGLQKCYPVQDK
jgi:predicted alpha/beta superfamily hydrolase